MTVSLRIDHDLKCLQTYFKRLLMLKDELEDKEKNFTPVAFDGESQEYPGNQFNASHLIMPDMVQGVYGFFEFWVQKLCEIQEKNQKLALRFSDIRGKNDLDAYHKYLTCVAGLQLDVVQSSHSRLHDLRRVRNKVIHQGSHILDSEQNEFGQIAGISTTGSLLMIREEFIWDALDHAKKYLTYVANAGYASFHSATTI